MRLSLPFRDAYTHLADIAAAIARIKRFIGDMDFTAYERDEKSKSAVERQLQIITEAAIRLGDDGEKVVPGPDWKAYRGMGNILRHAYHRVDDQIVWETIKTDIPSLKTVVDVALSKMGNEGAGR